MSGKRGKRTLLLCSLLLAVVGAGYANYVITSGGFGAEITPHLRSSRRAEGKKMARTCLPPLKRNGKPPGPRKCPI